MEVLEKALMTLAQLIQGIDAEAVTLEPNANMSSNCVPINNAVNNTISHSVSRASDAAIAASEFESRVQRLPGGRR
jgi:hypothetical protein